MKQILVTQILRLSSFQIIFTRVQVSVNHYSTISVNSLKYLSTHHIICQFTTGSVISPQYLSIHLSVSSPHNLSIHHGICPFTTVYLSSPQYLCIGPFTKEYVTEQTTCRLSQDFSPHRRSVPRATVRMYLCYLTSIQYNSRHPMVPSFSSQYQSIHTKISTPEHL